VKVAYVYCKPGMAQAASRAPVSPTVVMATASVHAAVYAAVYACGAESGCSGSTLSWTCDRLATTLPLHSILSIKS
jgi:hypothetical protein